MRPPAGGREARRLARSEEAAGLPADRHSISVRSHGEGRFGWGECRLLPGRQASRMRQVPAAGLCILLGNACQSRPAGRRPVLSLPRAAAASRACYEVLLAWRHVNDK